MKYLNVFICVTSYQMYISSVYAKKIFMYNGKRSLIVCKYIGGVQLTNCDYADYWNIEKSKLGKMKSLSIQIMLRTPFSKLKKWIVHNANVVYFNDRDPITKLCLKYASKKILIDEGIGVYYPSKGVKVIGLEPVPDYAIVGFPEIYKKTHASYNAIVELDYNSLFNCDNIEAFDLDVPEIHGDILFLGQCTPANEYIREFELNVISSLNDKYSVIVKPHPRDEKRNNYLINKGVEIIDARCDTLPIELLFTKWKFRMIVSLYSSGCVTIAKMFPNLQVAFAYKIFDKKINFEKMDSFVDNLDNLKLLRSVDELISMLNEKPLETKSMEIKEIDISPFCSMGNYSAVNNRGL